MYVSIYIYIFLYICIHIITYIFLYLLVENCIEKQQRLRVTTNEATWHEIYRKMVSRDMVISPRLIRIAVAYDAWASNVDVGRVALAVSWKRSSMTPSSDKEA